MSECKNYWATECQCCMPMSNLVLVLHNGRLRTNIQPMDTTLDWLWIDIASTQLKIPHKKCVDWADLWIWRRRKKYDCYCKQMYSFYLCTYTYTGWLKVNYINWIVISHIQRNFRSSSWKEKLTYILTCLYF